MAPVLLWFGQYPSAWIILVEGYITAEHSSGTGIMSAPSSPSHHARAAGRGCPQGVGCSSSLPHLLCSELSLLWDNMAFYPINPIGFVTASLGSLGLPCLAPSQGVFEDTGHLTSLQQVLLAIKPCGYHRLRGWFASAARLGPFVSFMCF